MCRRLGLTKSLFQFCVFPHVSHLIMKKTQETSYLEFISCLLLWSVKTVPNEMSTFHLVAGNQQWMSLGNIKRCRSAKPFSHPVNLFCVRRTFNRYLSDSLTHVSSKSHLERTIAFPGNLCTSVSEIYKRQYKSSYTEMMTIQILHTSKALRVTRSKGAPNIEEHREDSPVAPQHISYDTVSCFVQKQGQFLKRQSEICGQFLPNSSPKSPNSGTLHISSYIQEWARYYYKGHEKTLFIQKGSFIFKVLWFWHDIWVPQYPQMDHCCEKSIKYHI